MYPLLALALPRAFLWWPQAVLIRQTMKEVQATFSLFLYMMSTDVTLSVRQAVFSENTSQKIEEPSCKSISKTKYNKI